MKNIYLFVILLFFSCKLISQSPEWIVSIGVEIKYSKTDTNGNIYGVGVFKGTVDFDPSSSVFNLQTSSTKNNIFIVKYDNLGNFVWAKSLGNNENNESVIDFELYNDELYILGSFNGIVDFDFSSNDNSITGNSDVFVAKYTADANLIWVGSAVGDFNTFNLGLAINSFDNSLYICGNFNGIADFDLTTNVLNKDSGVGRDIFLVKYSLNGNLLWCKTAGGETGTGSINSISFDTNGNIYGIGTASGQNFDIDLGANQNNISSNFYSFLFIVKYTIDGDFINATEINHSNVETWGLSIKVGTNNTIFASQKSGYFAASNFYSTNRIVAYDASLTFLWDIIIQSENSDTYPPFITNIETTNDNNIIYGGKNTPGESTLMPFLSKYDENGASLFVNSDLQENDTFAHNQVGIIEGYGGLSSLCLFPDDSFVVFGNLTHTGPLPYIAIDLDISQEGESYITADNTYPNNSLFFMAKYSDLSLSTTDYSVLNNSLKIFPNPTNSKIYLYSALLENEGRITFHDLLGKTVFSKKTYSSLNNYEINVEFLESGVYYVKYKTGSKTEIKKLIKN